MAGSQILILYARVARTQFCLALDVEGSDGHEGGITSIGLTRVCDFLAGRQRTDISTDLTKMVQGYGIKGYDIVWRSQEKPRKV